MTVFISLFMIRRLASTTTKDSTNNNMLSSKSETDDIVTTKNDDTLYDGEIFLVPDHSSPVGYRVPALPDYEIDPSAMYTATSSFTAEYLLSCFSLDCEFVFGLFFVAAVGSAFLYLSVTNVDEELYRMWDIKIKEVFHSLNMTVSLNDTTTFLL